MASHHLHLGVATRRLLVCSAIILGSLLGSSGCYSYRVAPKPTPERAEVRVRFDPPRQVAVARGGVPGDTARIDGVTQIEGRVLAARGDTLQLALTRLVTDRRWPVPGYEPGRTALVVLQPGRPVELRGLSGSRTAAALLGIPAVSFVLLAAFSEALLRSP